MDTSSTSMRDLAQRLLAACQGGSEQHIHEAVLVSEKLRIALTRFAGADGFLSLQRRALLLAKAEVPALQNVTLGVDGRLEGFEEEAEEKHSGTLSEVASEAAIAITASLLGLLVTFIGNSFTLKLVREAWPELSLDEEFIVTEAVS